MESVIHLIEGLFKKWTEPHRQFTSMAFNDLQFACAYVVVVSFDLPTDNEVADAFKRVDMRVEAEEAELVHEFDYVEMHFSIYRVSLAHPWVAVKKITRNDGKWFENHAAISCVLGDEWTGIVQAIANVPR